MSRKLKKRIRELCGIEGLSKEDRLTKAHEVLADQGLKQYICNMMPGLTFKDIERAMNDEISGRKPRTKAQETYEDLERNQPDKLDPYYFDQEEEIERPIVKAVYETYSMEETNKMLASDILDRPDEKPKDTNYSTYSLEETYAVINGVYDSRNFSKPTYTESTSDMTGRDDGTQRRRQNKTQKPKVGKTHSRRASKRDR